MPSAKDFALEIKSILLNLLSPYLGQYKLANGDTVPSISIRQLGNSTIPTYQMVDGSGVECILEPEPDSIYKKTKFSGVNLIRRFRIILDQHDSNQTLADALDLIYSHPGISPMEPPTIRGRMQSPDQQGELPARAMLFVPVSAHLNSLY